MVKEHGKVVPKSSSRMKELKEESNATKRLVEASNTIRLSAMGIFRKPISDQDLDVKKSTVMGVIERAIKKIQYLVRKMAVTTQFIGFVE